MRYIIQYTPAPRYRRRGEKPRYWTVSPEGLLVEFKRLRRRVGNIQGLGPVVEDAGVDRSRVMLRSTREERAQDSLGKTTGLSHIETTLLNRHSTIRILGAESEEVLDSYDREIEQKLAELRELRLARKEAVAAAWSRAEKLDIADLEDKAKKEIA